MTRSRASLTTCTKCGTRCPAKRLTDLGPAGLRCPKCMDHIPSAERRSLLRKAGKR